MRKKKIIIIIMSVAILVILTTRIAGMVKNGIYGDKSTSSELGIDDVYIQRALAAKMLSLLKYSHNEIKGMESEITYMINILLRRGCWEYTGAAMNVGRRMSLHMGNV